jgi:hypothetical protein
MQNQRGNQNCRIAKMDTFCASAMLQQFDEETGDGVIDQTLDDRFA